MSLKKILLDDGTVRYEGDKIEVPSLFGYEYPTFKGSFSEIALRAQEYLEGLERDSELPLNEKMVFFREGINLPYNMLKHELELDSKEREALMDYARDYFKSNKKESLEYHNKVEEYISSLWEVAKKAYFERVSLKN